MTKFEICIRGQNFLIEEDGEKKKFGFYAARFIEAEDSSSALEIAMDSFRTELEPIVLNAKSDPPLMKVVEIAEVYYFTEKMEVGDMILTENSYLWDEEF